jgi:hypothetical protein
MYNPIASAERIKLMRGEEIFMALVCHIFPLNYRKEVNEFNDFQKE